MCFDAKEDVTFSFFTVGINKWQVIENLKAIWYMVGLAPSLAQINVLDR